MKGLLHHDFIDTAKKLGSQMAIIDTATKRELSYKRVLIAALILKKYIAEIDQRYVGVMLPTSAGCGIVLLASLFTGKIPVMINYSTGALENCRFAQRKCGFKTIITSRKMLDKMGLAPLSDMIFVEDLLDRVSAFGKIKAALIANLPAPVIKSIIAGGNLNDTVGIIFTSGSEKEPKGVELTHLSIGSNARAVFEHESLKEGDRIFSVLPMFHVFGFGTCFWLPIINGMTIISYANPLDAKIIVKLIREHKAEILVGTPFFIMSYMRAAKKEDFESLTLIVTGADKTPEWMHHTIEEKFGKFIIEGYGATETSPVITANSHQANKPGSVGKPIPGMEVKIIDLNTGTELGTGEEGKIFVRGDSLMKGYLGDVEETSLKIENGWYETGDMGLIDEDGFLWHKGRLKRFVKIGGEMVSLVKTELELEELLPEGCECCIVEFPDSKKGAVICAVTTQKIDEAKIKEQLSKRLPPIALPKKFVTLEELPKMGSGKIDFRTTTEIVRDLS
ncbi:MAG: AMP-binding protein [Gammaproteobacteria bacterium]|nr:AMP-binding protein [Gammaproteobacteria bacterium]